MVKLTKIYTKGGDAGETSLGDGVRRPKHDLRIETYGTVDEVNALIGVVRCALEGDGAEDRLMARVQNDLFDLGADLCVPEDTSKRGYQDYPPLRLEEAQVEALEQAIDQMNADLTPLNSFILPGGCSAAAQLHVARTVTRRAERLLSALMQAEDVNRVTLRYLNRLSDLLFVMARWCNDKGATDVLWIPGGERT
jgi:cob(I)alamin adenosyltransferase